MYILYVKLNIITIVDFIFINFQPLKTLKEKEKSIKLKELGVTLDSRDKREAISLCTLENPRQSKYLSNYIVSSQINKLINFFKFLVLTFCILKIYKYFKLFLVVGYGF